MKKNSLRVFSIIFVFVLLLVTGLSGCKKKPKEDDSSDNSYYSSDLDEDSGFDKELDNTSTNNNSTNSTNTITNTKENTVSKNTTISGKVNLMVGLSAEKETADMINIFRKKYPNVKVNVQISSGTSTVSQDLSKLAAAKKLPDVVLYGTENFGYIMSQGIAYPLDKLYANDPDKKFAFQAGIDNYTYFGHLYALPFRLQFNTIGVNTDMFQEINANKPGYNWTISEFIDLAKKATTTAYSGINYIYDGSDPTHGLDVGIMNCLLPDGFGLFGYNLNNHTFNFTNGAWVRSKEICKELTSIPGLVSDDLKKVKNGGTTAYEQKFGSGGDAMKAGKVLFTNTHSWRANWYDDMKFNWDLYPYPRNDNCAQRIQTHVDFVCMTTAVTESNRDAAYALLKTLSYDKDASISYIKYCENQYKKTKSHNLVTPSSANPDVINYYVNSSVYPSGMKYMYKQVMASKANVFVADANKIVPNFWNNVTQFQKQSDEQINSGTAPASLAESLQNKVNTATTKTWDSFKKKVDNNLVKFYETHPYEK